MLGEGSKSPLLFDPITVIFRFRTGLGLGNALKQHSHQGYGLCLRHGLRYWYCEIPFLSKKSCASQFGCMKLFLVSNDWKLYKLSEKYRFKGSFLNRNVKKIQSKTKNGKKMPLRDNLQKGQYFSSLVLKQNNIHYSQHPQSYSCYNYIYLG